MKSFIFLTAFLSLEAFAVEQCRVNIFHMDKLLGNNATLADQVQKKLEKKNIVLIDESELTEGDFTVPYLIGFWRNHPSTPKYEFKSTSKPKVTLVPCVAFPLCGPVVLEKEISGWTGLKYDHEFTVHVMKGGKKVPARYETFKHQFNQEPTAMLDYVEYDGSAEQEDLAIAIAEKFPKCSKLVKSGNIAK